MAVRVIMPKQGLQMVEGTITRWILKEGDRVEKGQLLLEIETDKAAMEITAPAAGTLLKIIRQEGDIVPVVETIAVIGSPGEDISGFEKNVRVFITPRAKKRAEEEAVDINYLTGTGPEGLVIENDVLKAAQHEVVEGKHEVVEGKEAIPQKINLRTAVQANHRMDVDVTQIVNLRQKFKSSNLNISYTDIFVKIAAIALKENPIINSTMTGKGILILEDINIAIAQDDGLAAPVIENADSLSINQIGRQSGSPDQSAMSGATFTIKNLGMYDIDSFTAIINPPESAILAIGKINKKPVADEGQVVIKPVITLSLTYDYRIIDGVAAAKFLLSIKKLILNPYLILFN